MMFKLNHYIVLLVNLSIRRISERYRGSYLGLIWLVLMPVGMLTVFVFVFSELLSVKWGGDDKYQFALFVFPGLIIFNYFSSVVSSSTTLMLDNSNYIKKISFPLTIFPVRESLSEALVLIIGMLIWIGAISIFNDVFSFSFFYAFLYLINLFFYVSGLAFLISAICVYLRDLSYLILSFMTALFFLTPVFYPMSEVAEGYRNIMDVNPLSSIISDVRRLVLYQENFNFLSYLESFKISILIFFVGFVFFNKLKKGFYDVV